MSTAEPFNGPGTAKFTTAFDAVVGRIFDEVGPRLDELTGGIRSTLHVYCLTRGHYVAVWGEMMSPKVRVTAATWGAAIRGLLFAMCQRVAELDSQ